jgi:hypothetical protein
MTINRNNAQDRILIVYCTVLRPIRGNKVVFTKNGI